MTLVSAPAFGDGNAALQPLSAKDASKKKKPKNNMTKSNSSFISRVIVNEHLTKKLTDRPLEGVFLFANINRAFQWLDMSGTKKQRVSRSRRAVAAQGGHADSLTARLSDQGSIHQGALPVP